MQIKVKSLEDSSAFYEEVLGLRRGLYDESRKWLFLWVGNNAGMLVLQESEGEWPIQHFAFKVDVFEIDNLKTTLEEKGLNVEGPVELDWMNAKSLYIEDPDGNDVEFCALLN